ncbi:MAG TPA: hypothetical protein VGH28_23840 [Polyangiaceae bacterium]
MKDRVLGLAAAACVLLTGGVATAQSRGEGSSREAISTAKETPEEAVPVKAREPLFLGLDFTLGFGTYSAALTQNPLPPAFQTHSVLDTTSFRTTTFNLLGHYDFKHWGLGVRFPLISGHIDSDPANQVQSQDLFTSGNLEVSGDFHKKLSEQILMVPEIALTLPTSPGSTPPNTQTGLDANQPSDSVADQYQRYAVGLAAAFARGGEDDALYFNWRLGITPKLGFDMKFNHTIVQPYVKIPIMFGLEQNPGAEEPVRIEAVGAVRVAQQIGPVTLGVRVVGMIPIAARTTLKTPMLSVWPEARLQITPSGAFWLSGMIPLGGDYAVYGDAPLGGKNGAFEAGISATF